MTKIIPEYETSECHGIFYDASTDDWYSCVRHTLDSPSSEWLMCNRLDVGAIVFYKALALHYMGQNRILPERFRGGVERYVEHGIEPGHFLRAVLESNLVATFYRADDISREQIPIILAYFNRHLPETCWGSAEVVETWIKKNGRSGDDGCFD